jgi:hypothetical protein
MREAPLAPPQVVADYFPISSHNQSNQKAMPLRSLTTENELADS